MLKLKMKMKKLLEKELELIKPTLKSHISTALEKNYKTTLGTSITKVLGVHIGEIDVDEYNSNFREQIIINDIKLKARVKTNCNSSKKESTIKLKLNKEIHLFFIKKINEYKVINNTNSNSLLELV